MSRRRDERGAIALLVAILSTVIMAVSMLVVDIGMQRVLRRDLQALADVVALDLARELDGRTKAELAPEVDSALGTSALSQSVARNGDTLGDAPDVTATLGGIVGGVFVATVDPPTAVQVVADSEIDYAIAPGEGGATRSAIGAATTSACFSVGSYAARFRSGDSALISTLVDPMNGFLRPQANIDAVSYTGLANAFVSLNELAAAGTVGSVDQLLTQQVTAADLIEASITALQRQSPVNTVAISALQRVLNGQAELSTPILLSDFLSISPTDTAALETKLNVLDLVTGSVLVADGEHFIDLGNLSAGIGNLAPIGDAQLTVIERARMACGPFGSPESTAESSQVRGDVQMKLQLPSIHGITGATGVVQTPESTVDLDIDLGNATGTLADEPECNQGTSVNPDLMDVRVQSGLSTFRLSTDLHFEAKVSVLGLGLVTTRFYLQATAQQVMPDATTMANLRIPPNDATPVSTGTSAPLGYFTVASVPSGLTATVGGLPVALGPVQAALAPVIAQLQVNASVVGPLNSLVDSVNAQLVPLRTLMGLNVSGADVLALGRPVCGAPALRG
ncbi:pilus assembly protein TadG-related protein [Nocardioides gansuensis]|uniref:pilus assembly protein TadG-related protein n=1 Tax=Nocardioides gansuensis TaxID=2138300 RepID=UPI001403B63B|nr:pilus assembly protein TadG-related protein [Nocardioides gansuensis]